MVVTSGILAIMQAMNKFQDCEEIQADGTMNIKSKAVKRYPSNDAVQLNETCIILLLRNL
eukprot:8489943-Ditylum_brightwellii.AAC.1